MRISDWSSDVGSSVLSGPGGRWTTSARTPSSGCAPRATCREAAAGMKDDGTTTTTTTLGTGLGTTGLAAPLGDPLAAAAAGRALHRDRKSVMEGKSGAVRVDSGGRLLIQKKKK